MFMLTAALTVLLLVVPGYAQTPVPFQSSCGPKILIQVPQQGKSYNGPTILEGDVYEADVTVTVVVDGKTLPVTLAVMNPGPKQFWRWSTPKYKVNGAHTAVITATNKVGSTVVTPRFSVVAR